MGKRPKLYKECLLRKLSSICITLNTVFLGQEISLHSGSKCIKIWIFKFVPNTFLTGLRFESPCRQMCQITSKQRFEILDQIFTFKFLPGLGFELETNISHKVHCDLVFKLDSFLPFLTHCGGYCNGDSKNFSSLIRPIR